MATAISEFDSNAAAPVPPTPTLSDDIIVRVENLTKTYEDRTVVDRMTFDIRRGEILGFLGPNGAGKSTTIAMMLGLIDADAGHVSFFGLPEEQRSEALQRVGAIIESPAFYPFLSGRENLLTLSRLRPGVPQERVEQLLEIVGLTEAADRPFRQYSLGMKQRLGIGWTMLGDPELLILDEPTNGLDPQGQAEVRELLRDLRNRGKSIMVSSHLLRDMQDLCDRVVIIRRGQFVTEGRVDDLISSQHRIIIRTPQTEQAVALLRQTEGVASVHQNDGQIDVVAPSIDSGVLNRALVLANIEVDELRIAGSLEEVFLAFTGESSTP